MSDDKPDEPADITLEQIKQRSLIDYVVDRIEAEADAVEVLDGGEVVISISGPGLQDSRND